MSLIDGQAKFMQQLSEALEHYYMNNSTFAAMGAEMMKIDRETGDIAMETINFVILNPLTFKILAPVLPILHEESARAIFLEVLEETMKRIGQMPDDGVDLGHEPGTDTNPT